MLPIVPGCKAVIIYSVAGNEGKIVTAIKYIGVWPGRIKNDNWEIDREISLMVRTVRPNGEIIREKIKGTTKVISESALMRIDGNEELFKMESEEEIPCVW